MSLLLGSHTRLNYAIVYCTTEILILLFSEISRIQSGGNKNGGYKEPVKYFDIYRERPIRLTIRALVPVREHPKVRSNGTMTLQTKHHFFIGIYVEIYYFQTSNAMPCLSEVSSSSCLRDHYHCCLRQKLRLVFL